MVITLPPSNQTTTQQTLRKARSSLILVTDHSARRFDASWAMLRVR